MNTLFNRLQDEIDVRSADEEGLSPIDLLDLPEAVASLINHIVRHNGMKLDAIAQMLEQSPLETRHVMDNLVDKGYIRKITVKDQIWYKAHFGRKADRTSSTGIWSVLDDITG